MHRLFDSGIQEINFICLMRSLNEAAEGSLMAKEGKGKVEMQPKKWTC